MNLLRNGLLMRKTGDRRRTELAEESASQCGFSAEFITRSSPKNPWDLRLEDQGVQGLLAFVSLNHAVLPLLGPVSGKVNIEMIRHIRHYERLGTIPCLGPSGRA